MGINRELLPICWSCALAEFQIDEERLLIGEYDPIVAPPNVNGVCKGATVNMFIRNEGEWEILQKPIVNHRISSQQPCNLAENAGNGPETFKFRFIPK